MHERLTAEDAKEAVAQRLGLVDQPIHGRHVDRLLLSRHIDPAALATQIAYTTSLPQQDTLALTWGQYSDGGLTVTQKKKRGGEELWIPLSQETRQMLDDTERTSTHIIVNEQTASHTPIKTFSERPLPRSANGQA